jgi:serine/threonine protein phosphatase PrpC
MAVELLRQCLEAEAAFLAAYGAAPTVQGRTLLAAQMRRAVEHANAEVFARSEREPELHQMGSTLEVVVLAGNEAFIAHVGDSRTYLVRNGKVAQLTVDHTVAETMRRAGTLTDEEARVSPMRSVLSNAIGVTPTVSVDLLRIELRAGDRLLVCSDGLHDYFSRDELSLHLDAGDPDHVLDRLIDHARQGGGHDNITGIVIEARTRPSATAPPLSVEELEDAATSPKDVPVPAPNLPSSPNAVPAPLEGVSDRSLANFIDQSLHEGSRPNLLEDVTGEPGN